jgi:FAD/FMN-containing dehydrogenase
MTALHAELDAIVGNGGLLTDPVDLIAYGFDGTFFDNSPPLVVLPSPTGSGRRAARSRRRWRAAGRTNSGRTSPRRSIPQMVRRVREIAAKYRLEIPIFGHIGDGNLHPNILCDKTDPEVMTRVTAAAREIFETAVSLGGTLSGEHGIGLLKKQFLELDLGPDVNALTRRLKAAVDPEGIMNPGKIFPAPGGIGAFRL